MPIVLVVGGEERYLLFSDLFRNYEKSVLPIDMDVAFTAVVMGSASASSEQKVSPTGWTGLLGEPNSARKNDSFDQAVGPTKSVTTSRATSSGETVSPAKSLPPREERTEEEYEFDDSFAIPVDTKMEVIAINSLDIGQQTLDSTISIIMVRDVLKVGFVL